MPGIKGIWSLRLSEEAAYDKFLVQAYIGETRILSIDNEEMSEVGSE
jgi:DNA damage-binding protein 1